MPRAPALSEAAIQRQIVDYAARCVPGARIFAIPNAAPRRPGQRAANAVAGLTRGVPDLALIVRGGTTIWVEVKSARGKLRAEQKEMLAWMSANAVPAITVRSLDDFKIALGLFRIKTREAA